VLTLFALSSVALAQETEDEEHDTVFNFGYDAENQYFVWGSSSTDGTLNCNQTTAGELAGEYEADYIVTPDGLVTVMTLASGGTGVEFVTNEEGGTPEAYTQDGECALTGGSVAGPERQINHGMFLRLFNSMYDGAGRGCIIRHIAQSDLGKGDQQIEAGEADPAFEPGDSGILVVESALASCQRPNGGGDDDTDDGPGNGGRPEGAGPPPWAGQPGGPDGPPGGDED
jgi:hypothetical protein